MSHSEIRSYTPAELMEILDRNGFDTDYFLETLDDDYSVEDIVYGILTMMGGYDYGEDYYSDEEEEETEEESESHNHNDHEHDHQHDHQNDHQYENDHQYDDQNVNTNPAPGGQQSRGILDMIKGSIGNGVLNDIKNSGKLINLPSLQESDSSAGSGDDNLPDSDQSDDVGSSGNNPSNSEEVSSGSQKSEETSESEKSEEVSGSEKWENFDKDHFFDDDDNIFDDNPTIKIYD